MVRGFLPRKSSVRSKVLSQNASISTELESEMSSPSSMNEEVVQVSVARLRCRK